MSDRTLSDHGRERMLGNLSSLFKKDRRRLFLISIDACSIELVAKASILF
jgi:hypothetical protein